MARKKKSKLYRTDLVQHFMNGGKEAKVRALLSAWRRGAGLIANEQWRLFYEAGGFNKQHKAETAKNLLPSAHCQMARYQVVGVLESFIANRQNEFTLRVARSQLPSETKHALHFINRWRAWFSREPLTNKDGVEISADIRVLARQIMRHLLRRHCRPSFARTSMLIDQRGVDIQASRKTALTPVWARLATLDKGQSISVPLMIYPQVDQRGGERAKTLQVIERDSGLIFGVMTDVTTAFADSRAAYVPRLDAIALDLGLRTLFATDRGDLLGRDWLDRLLAIDTRITKLAAHRQRIGLKPRSARYRKLVTRLRGFVASEIGRILNRLVKTHAPAEIVVERLDFRNPALSRRLNRLLSLIGKGVIQRKLQDLTERLGVVVTQVNPAYSSQTDHGCGYIDKKNRTRQDAFSCRWCGGKRHADVNAARNLLVRRSDQAMDSRRPKHAILIESVRRFNERFTRTRGSPEDLRLSNPYFTDWKSSVTLTGSRG